MVKSLEFKPVGSSDGLTVTKPCGAVIELSGESVIEFSIRKFGHGGVGIIKLVGFPLLDASKYNEIERRTGARVFLGSE